MYCKSIFIPILTGPQATAPPSASAHKWSRNEIVSDRRARAVVELLLHGQLDVVGMRAVHIVVKGVIQDREEPLWWARVG